MDARDNPGPAINADTALVLVKYKLLNDSGILAVSKLISPNNWLTLFTLLPPATP